MSNSVTRVITLEEHYVCPEVDTAFRKVVDQSRLSATQRAKLAASEQFVKESPLTDIGARRLAWMDGNGVDMQVLSYGDNCPQDLPAKDAVSLCRLANDYLAEHCKKHPDRFAGFAVLPVDAPEEAAKEAKRAITELGLKGIGFKATYRGEEFLDGKRFAPIFEAIAELNVPFYLHPTETVPAVTASYYEGDSIPAGASQLLSGFGIGWHYETGVAYLRLIASGLLDAYPDMKLLIGHWGELIPFYFDRLDISFGPVGERLLGVSAGLPQRKVSDYFRQNMYVMPSGLHGGKVMDSATLVCLKEFGADRIVWANDYPYRGESDLPNTKDWIGQLEVSPEDREKIAHGNAERLLGL